VNYEEAISYLNRFQFHGFKLGIERIEAILQALKRPHQAYPLIHVAGTNGKGSVCAYLSSILMTAGHKVGRYTSPHLWSLVERFDINGHYISHNELAHAIERIKGYVEQGLELSYFEYTTAIAFKWFEEQQVNVAVVETGLGGRLDATNVISPLCAVITNVDLDHMSYLGNTLEQIAFEKAGIIKPDIPVVTGVQDSAALAVIADRARSLNAPVFRLGKDFAVKAVNGGMEYKGLHVHLPIVRPGLLGRHQYQNAALALAACEVIGQHLSISEAALKQGIEAATWPCRGELLQVGGRRVLLDGAHNPHGIQALCTLLEDLKCDSQKAHLLFGVSNEGGDKDFVGMLRRLSPFFRGIYITEPPGPRRPVYLEEWQEKAHRLELSYIKDWKQALEACLNAAGNLVCVAGSLYLVGAVRHLLQEKGPCSS